MKKSVDFDNLSVASSVNSNKDNASSNNSSVKNNKVDISHIQKVSLPNKKTMDDQIKIAKNKSLQV
jgi:hypothetical protein